MWLRRLTSRLIRPAPRRPPDMIGPPCPDSMLRPIKFATPPNETALEYRLRLKRRDLQRWNQEFWSAHNRNFRRQRQEFIDAELKKRPEGHRLTADEMSVFYKNFLDARLLMHKRYNYEWYYKNLHLLYLTYEVFVERLLARFKL